MASHSTARPALDATKTAVLEALGGGDAMTGGEIAAATGLGQATVSSTLSELTNTGEVTKAARGYQLARQSSPADVAASTESAPPSA